MKRLTALIILLALALTPLCFGEETDASGGQLCSFHDYTGKMPFRFDDMSASDGTYFTIYKTEDIEEYNGYLDHLVSCGYSRYDFEDTAEYKSCAMTYGGTDTYFYSYYYANYSEAVMIFYADKDYGFDPIDDLD